MEQLKMGIVNSCPLKTSYGGVGPFMKNLDPYLSERYDVTYITLPDAIHRIQFIPRRLIFMLYLLMRINKFRKYDVILSHVPEGSFMVSFTKTPFIHIFHGNHNPMSQSRFWFGKYFVPIFDAFEKRIFEKSSLRFTVGNEMADVKKILNPIHHNIPVTDKALREGFIFAGRLEVIKNVDKIIQIYAALPEAIRNQHRLYIAGAGSQDKKLKQLVKTLLLDNRVEFLGSLPNEQLVQALSTKKMMIMASSQEGLPMAIAEALSLGLPVISTDTGDISRAIKPDYNGFLFPIAFDVQKYAEKVEVVLSDYDRFADNALISSAMFKAATVSKALGDDIDALLKNAK